MKKLKTLLKIIIKKINFLLNTIWALPISLVIYIVRPLYDVKICKIWSSRVGHFTHDTVENKIAVKLKKKNQLILFCVDDQIANKFWYEMAKRELPLIRPLIYVWMWCKILPFLQNNIKETSDWGSHDPYGNFYKYLDKKDFIFTEKENDIGIKFLKNNGIENKQKIITILVRDEEFLVNDPLTGRGDVESRKFWNYHSYRNGKIHDYEKAIEWLLRKEYVIIRMGKIAKNELKLKHKNLIDYAFSPDRSDFLDIWLFSKCKFCITTGSGIDAIADIYKNPILYINILPISNLTFYNNSKWVPKKLHWIENGKELTMKQYIEADYHRSQDFIANGIQFTDLNENEIYEEIKQFINEQENQKYLDSEIHLSKNFFDELIKTLKFDADRLYIHKNCRVSKNFIQRVS
jgi:putative glycosyltransferase (TIGR04372 family)